MSRDVVDARFGASEKKREGRGPGDWLSLTLPGLAAPVPTGHPRRPATRHPMKFPVIIKTEGERGSGSINGEKEDASGKKSFCAITFSPFVFFFGMLACGTDVGK